MELLHPVSVTGARVRAACPGGAVEVAAGEAAGTGAVIGGAVRGAEPGAGAARILQAVIGAGAAVRAGGAAPAERGGRGHHGGAVGRAHPGGAVVAGGAQAEVGRGAGAVAAALHVEELRRVRLRVAERVRRVAGED